MRALAKIIIIMVLLLNTSFAFDYEEQLLHAHIATILKTKDEQKICEFVGDDYMRLLESFYVSIKYNSEDALKILISCKPGQIYDALFTAVSHNNFMLVKFLFANYELNAKERDPFRASLLHHAAKNNNKEMILYFIHQHKIHPNTRDKSGYRPLHVAVVMGHREVVEILIEKGAKVFRKDEVKIWDLATYYGHHDLAIWLKRQGKSILWNESPPKSPLGRTSEPKINSL